MAKPLPIRPALLLAPAMLASCAAPQGDYPSLQIRPAERIDPDAEAPTPPPPAPIPAAVMARAQQLRGEAIAANRTFEQQVPAVSRRVEAARGAAIASDRWADAQVAIAALDTARSRTADPLAELDLLYAERAVELAERGAIDGVRQEVAALLAGQDATLARLKAAIAP